MTFPFLRKRKGLGLTLILGLASVIIFVSVIGITHASFYHTQSAENYANIDSFELNVNASELLEEGGTTAFTDFVVGSTYNITITNDTNFNVSYDLSYDSGGYQLNTDDSRLSPWIEYVSLKVGDDSPSYELSSDHLNIYPSSIRPGDTKEHKITFDTQVLDEVIVAIQEGIDASTTDEEAQVYLDMLSQLEANKKFNISLQINSNTVA